MLMRTAAAKNRPQWSRRWGRANGKFGNGQPSERFDAVHRGVSAAAKKHRCLIAGNAADRYDGRHTLAKRFKYRTRATAALAQSALLNTSTGRLNEVSVRA